MQLIVREWQEVETKRENRKTKQRKLTFLLFMNLKID